MEDLHALPEQAICAFELGTRTMVTVHDFSNELWAFLSPGRFEHTTAHCQAIKPRMQHACTRFDVDFLRREMPRFPHGLVKQCHAGLVEWVVPVFWDDSLKAILFAGQRGPSPELPLDLRDTPASPKLLPWSGPLSLPPPVNETESRMILELLRQLGARLTQWHTQHEAAGIFALRPRRGRKDGYRNTNEAMNRREVIQRFIRINHDKPEVSLLDLAKQLHLSESRAGHAVRETCGQTFVELISESRLRRAANWLRHSELSVLEIGIRCGFGDISHFHRQFKRHFKTTPHQYRKQREGNRPQELPG